LDLTAFVESHVKGLRLEKSERVPRPASCLSVKKVAKRSIAARAGVAPGDLLSLVDGSPASRLSPKLYDDRAKKRLLTFYSPARREVVELDTTGIEIGIELDQTAEDSRPLQAERRRPGGARAAGSSETARCCSS
jgi:C-terminal processing protease CtpA/Prc